ncbi:hypothetical protein EUGRSUZ_D02178 [Eucalyptus grandis]|uniref:Uncharacterized protein n=2 Tax=Eucalyptus grandis TaxID=71139 RepID=A0ACC3L7Y8_EUCGR|nr:hypothetical protein EUGRSUZ_D02178 [Eucalyptus grandis]
MIKALSSACLCLSSYLESLRYASCGVEIDAEVNKVELQFTSKMANIPVLHLLTQRITPYTLREQKMTSR